MGWQGTACAPAPPREARAPASTLPGHPPPASLTHLPATQQAVETAELHAGFHAPLREPAARHLQGEKGRRRSAVRLLAERLHVGDIDDRAACIDECDRQ